MKNKTFYTTIFLAMSISISCFSQNSPKYFGEIYSGFFIPDGKAKLVRGERKVVTTDMLNTYSAALKFGYKISESRYVLLFLNHANVTYNLKEDYTGGLKIYSDDDFSMTALNIGIQQYVGDGKIRPYGAVSLGYVIFQNDIDLLGEEYLNPLPEDEIEIFPYKYKTHNYFGLGVEVGLEAKLSARVGLTLNSRFYLTDMRASLVNDPEDDGVDIESPVNAFSINLGMKYYF